jgi:hypothetical protein
MSAVASKRNGGGGGGGHTPAAASNGNSKSCYPVASTAATVLRKDPAALLARGYTARYLGAVLQAYNNKSGNKNPNIPSITTLSNEEIERDLRHICAYQDAATRYHQLTYAATNHINLNAAAKSSANQDAQHADGTGSSHLDPTTTSSLFARAALPVRIDPEEEKRRLTAQKRIQRAEAVREELEQQYVALRAHYVVTTQELQSFSQESEKTIETLQQCVASTATILGYQRAKLQMTREVAAAFQYRTNMIVSREYGAAATDAVAPSSTTATSPDDPTTITLSQGSETNNESTVTTTSDHQFPLLAAWNFLEEEYKRYVSVGVNGTRGVPKGTKGKQAAAAAAAATIIPWPCTMEPSTSHGIPQLLSALSTVPEKSVAVQTGNMFGSTNPHSLTWMESHLPSMMDDDGDDIFQTEADAVQLLRLAVASLEEELLRERQLNQEILVKTGQSRVQHDEWVAMISLVRQETEAVLYRHNVLLESDEVRDAIANLATNATASVEAVSSSTTMTMSHAHEDDDDDDAEEDRVGVEDVEHEQDHDEADDTNHANDNAIATAGADSVGVTISADLSADKVSGVATLEEEGASEADDEGMEEEGEDVDDWDTTNNNNTNTTSVGNNKRSATANGNNNNNTNEDSEGSPGGSRKRRKV